MRSGRWRRFQRFDWRNKTDATKPAVAIIGDDTWLNLKSSSRSTWSANRRASFVARNGVRALARFAARWISCGRR